eukprot:9099544-Prorocentrum_lima.AAC.1
MNPVRGLPSKGKYTMSSLTGRLERKKSAPSPANLIMPAVLSGAKLTGRDSNAKGREDAWDCVIDVQEQHGSCGGAGHPNKVVHVLHVWVKGTRGCMVICGEERRVQWKLLRGGCKARELLSDD